MRKLLTLIASAILLLWSQPAQAQQKSNVLPNGQPTAQMQAFQNMQTRQFNQQMMFANPLMRAQMFRNQLQMQLYQKMMQAQIYSTVGNSGYISVEQQARLQHLGRNRFP